jgi:hypothetical protein
MRQAGVPGFGARADGARACRPCEVWVAVLTRPRRVPTLAGVKKRILLVLVVVAALLLAGLALVLRPGD